jgi:hypothetical protein
MVVPMVARRNDSLPPARCTSSHGTEKIVIPEPIEPRVLAINSRRTRPSRSRSFMGDRLRVG